MNEFERYRKAYDAMEADAEVIALRRALREAGEKLRKAEGPYQIEMAVQEIKIKAAVLIQGQSGTLFDVEARLLQDGDVSVRPL